jgi:molybdate transport system substrate-binding protein
LTPFGRWAIGVFRNVQDQLGRASAGLLAGALQHAPALHLLAAISLEEVVGQLVTDFAAQRPALPVRTVFGGSDELADNVLAGAPADVFLTADVAQLERLQAAGLTAQEPVTLAANGLRAICLAGHATPIHTPDDLGRCAAARVALAQPGCPLGRYTRAYLEKRRLYQTILPRAVQAENSRAVVNAVRAGQADVGLVYSSDAQDGNTFQTLFEVRRLPEPMRYLGVALGGRHRSPIHACNLLEFLASPAARQRFRRCGFHVARLN